MKLTAVLITASLGIAPLALASTHVIHHKHPTKHSAKPTGVGACYTSRNCTATGWDWERYTDQVYDQCSSELSSLADVMSTDGSFLSNGKCYKVHGFNAYTDHFPGEDDGSSDVPATNCQFRPDGTSNCSNPFPGISYPSATNCQLSADGTTSNCF